MTTQKVPYGLIIRDLIREKKREITDVAQELGTSRNNVYNAFGRETMKLKDIEAWAKVLGVDKQLIIDRAEGKENGEGVMPPNGYLMEKLNNLEAMFQTMNVAFTNTLREKDAQISKLIDLLGKHEGVPNALYLIESPFFGLFSESIGYTQEKKAA